MPEFVCNLVILISFFEICNCCEMVIFCFVFVLNCLFTLFYNLCVEMVDMLWTEVQLKPYVTTTTTRTEIFNKLGGKFISQETTKQ